MQVRPPSTRGTLKGRGPCTILPKEYGQHERYVRFCVLHFCGPLCVLCLQQHLWALLLIVAYAAEELRKEDFERAAGEAKVW